MKTLELATPSELDYTLGALNTVEELLARVRSLPLKDRAHIVKELIRGLDEGLEDADAKQAWVAEIEKRALEVLNGNAVEETGEMFSRIRSELRRGRREGVQTPRGGRGRIKSGGKLVRGPSSRSR